MPAVRVLPPDHPDAIALVAAMAREFPAWHPDSGEEWGLDGDAFVALYEGDRPVGGAGIRDGGEGIAAVSPMCVPVEWRGRGFGNDLLDALEDVARERGFERLRLGSSCFMLGSEVPFGPAGYTVGPPYAGDADVPVWAEKELRAEGDK